MIRYTLRCDKGHEFEAWFSSSQAFEEQKRDGHVECAVCGSQSVEKALMAPMLRRTDKGVASAGAPAETMPAQPTAAAGPLAAGVGGEMPAELKAALRALRKAVEQNADYVGKAFAEEARKIHYGEADARGIYGEASREDTAALEEEGIEVYPLPLLPEDQN